MVDCKSMVGAYILTCLKAFRATPAEFFKVPHGMP